jgi:hypothetical protein
MDVPTGCAIFNVLAGSLNVNPQVWEDTTVAAALVLQFPQ